MLNYCTFVSSHPGVVVSVVAWYAKGLEFETQHIHWIFSTWILIDSLFRIFLSFHFPWKDLLFFFWLLGLSAFRGKPFCFSCDYFFFLLPFKMLFCLIKWIFGQWCCTVMGVSKLTLCDRTLILIGVISLHPPFLVIAISLKP